MKNKSKISLENCQIKSAEKFKSVAQAIDLIEKETFVGSGLISFSGMFICPDIDLVQFYKSGDPTERLLAVICIGLHVKRYGKNSRAEYLAIDNSMKDRDRKARVRRKGGVTKQGTKPKAKGGNKPKRKPLTR
jgi:hypothetical protein